MKLLQIPGSAFFQTLDSFEKRNHLSVDKTGKVKKKKSQKYYDGLAPVCVWATFRLSIKLRDSQRDEVT